MGKLKAAMIAKMLSVIFELALNKLDKETAKNAVDTILDWIEDKVQKSPTKWDDATILPVCEKVRDLLNIPDND